MYTECGKVDDAAMIFDKIVVKKLGGLNSMIVDFSQNDLCNEALILFWHMHLQGLEPNLVIILNILLSCGNFIALQAGCEIHYYSMRRTFNAYVYVGNALTAMHV